MRKHSLLDQALDLEENKNLYSASERDTIRKSLRIKIGQKLSKLNKRVVQAMDDVNDI